MGYAQDAMVELHGDRVIDNTPPTVQEANKTDALSRRREFLDRDPVPTSASQWAKDAQGREYLKPTVLMEVQRELSQARTTHAPMNSHHEGYAVILEELDELWAECKSNTHAKDTPESERPALREAKRQRMRKEAIQVAAMAIRFVEDICDK